jgi:hypothetical protein
MVSWGPNLVFPFPTKGLNICNSCTSATPKVGVHLGVIGFHPLHFRPFVRICFTPKHIFWLHGPLHFTLSHELNVRVVTVNM